MSSTKLLMSATAVALAIGVGASMQVAGQTRTTPPLTQQPVFVPGPVEVVGGVNIVNEPIVSARQAGPWAATVTAAGPLTVMSNAPALLTPGRTYRFQWPTGSPERYRILSIEANGWVRAELVQDNAGQSPPIRWLNTAMAVSIEEG